MKAKSNSRLLLLGLTAITVTLAAPSAVAATYYWDNNGATAGFGTAAGTWAAPTTGDATQGWSTSTTGASVPASVTTLSTSATVDALNFGNTTTGLAAGSIAVSGTVQSGSITFATGSGAIALSGGVINLTGTATVAGPSITVNNAADSISSDLTGAAASTLAGLTKAGTGALTLSGNDTYTGTTSLSAGILILNSATAIPGGIATTGGTGGLSFNGGALGLASGDFTRSSSGATQNVVGQFASSANTGAWWAAYGADRIVNVGGAGASQSWFNGKPINFGYATATNMVTLANAMNVTTVTRPVVVIRGTGPVDGRFGGVVAENAGVLAGMSVTGTGILAVTGNSTFTGNIIANTGSTVVANSLANSGSASPIGQGTYGVTLNGGTFQYAPVAAVGGGGHTTNRNIGISASSSLDASGTGALVLSQTGIMSPDVSGVAFTATGTNTTMTLAASYPALAVGMTVSGTGVAANTKISSFSSTATTTTITLSATVTATSGSANFGFATGRTLTLTGTNTGANTLAGILQDSSAAGAGVLGLTKAGAGVWSLSGLNTFTGNVTVNGGVLAAAVQGSGGASALGGVSSTRTITVNAGGTLRSDVGSLFNNNFASDATSVPALNIAGGTLTNTGTSKNSALGNVTLAGGTLNASVGSASGYGSWNLNGTVTSTGISTISSSASAPITLSAATVTATTFAVQSGTLTVSAALGQVTGTGSSDDRISSLTKTGSGVMVLTAANTYTGGTVVNAGTLLLSGAVNLPATGALQVNAGGNFSLADGTVGTTSAASLSLTDGARLTFDWNAGAVDTLVSTAAATTAGSVLIAINPLNSPSGTGLTLVSSPSGGLSGATYLLLNNTGNSLAVSDTAVQISLGGATPLTSAYWLGGQIPGNLASMAVSSSSSSNWATNASGTSSGGVVPGAACDVFFSASAAVQQANVVLGADMSVNSLTFNDIAPVTIGAGNTLTLNSAGSGTASAISANQSATINSGLVLAANSTWTVANAMNLTVGGVVSGGFSLSKAGAGALILSGSNLYSGGTSLAANSGSVQATITQTGSSLGTGPVFVDAGSSVLLLDTSTTSVTNVPLIGNVFTGSGLLQLQFAAVSTARNTYLPNVAGFGGTIHLSTAGATGDKWNATGLGTVPGSLIIDSGAQLYVPSGNTSFTGGITLNGTGNTENRGALRIGTATAVVGGNIALASSSTISMEALGSSLTGNISSGVAGPQLLTLGGSGSVGGTLSGIIGGGTGTLAVTTAVSGNYTLTGVNTYTGDTTVGAGTLTLGGAGQLGSGSYAGAISNAGTFAYSSSANQELSGAISGAGTLNKSGASSLTLSGANTYTGNTAVSTGILNIANAANTTTGVFIIGAGATLNLASFSDYGVASAMGSRLQASDTNGATDSATSGIGLHFQGGTLQYTGSTPQSTNRMIRMNTTTTNTIDASGTGSGTLTFTGAVTQVNLFDTAGTRTLNLTGSNAGANTFGIALTDQASSPTSLVKSGIGTWVLTGANTYTGTTSVIGGTLSVAAIADSGASNIGPSGTVSFANGATLLYTGTGSSTTARGFNASSGSGVINVSAAAGTLGITGAITGTYTQTLAKSGDGTLALGGAADNGSLILDAEAGLVQLGKTTSGSSHAVAGISNIASGATVQLGGSGGDQIYNGGFQTPFGLVNMGGGTLDLNGVNEEFDRLTGTGMVINSLAATTSTLTLGSAGGSGSFGGSLTNGSGVLALIKTGIGTLTLTGANTYSGNTTVNAGTLTLGNAPDPANANPANDASTVTIAATGATLNLTYTGTDIVNALYVGTTQMAAGVYGPGHLVIPQITGTGTLTVMTGPPGFASWITGSFANGTVPSGKQGPNDVPMNDGVSNLLKYAIAGQDPTVNNPTISTFSANTLSFTKRAGTNGLSYSIVQSSDLGVAVPWTEVPAGPAYTNDASIVSYTLTPGSPVKNFIRLKVTQAP